MCECSERTEAKMLRADTRRLPCGEAKKPPKARRKSKRRKNHHEAEERTQRMTEVERGRGKIPRREIQRGRERNLGNTGAPTTTQFPTPPDPQPLSAPPTTPPKSPVGISPELARVCTRSQQHVEGPATILVSWGGCSLLCDQRVSRFLRTIPPARNCQPFTFLFEYTKSADHKLNKLPCNNVRTEKNR